MFATLLTGILLSSAPAEAATDTTAYADIPICTTPHLLWSRYRSSVHGAPMPGKAQREVWIERDLNGDGYLDRIQGLPGRNASGRTDSGAVAEITKPYIDEYVVIAQPASKRQIGKLDLRAQQFSGHRSGSCGCCRRIVSLSRHGRGGSQTTNRGLGRFEGGVRLIIQGHRVDFPAPVSGDKRLEFVLGCLIPGAALCRADQRSVVTSHAAMKDKPTQNRGESQ